MTQNTKANICFHQQIPYDLTKSLILSFLGPHAKTITPDLGPAIHIIMDRSTGKTMDCYVEFFSTPDARACVNSLNLRPNNANRIGDRAVDVTTSSQDELLKELFPRAKNVRWEAGKPVVMETTEAFNSGFKSFVSAEELGCLVRHAEQPHRVSESFYYFIPRALVFILLFFALPATLFSFADALIMKTTS